jgi:hypothetical protein
VGKHLGAIMPPIGKRTITFTGIVPRRFHAIGDTTEHDGFGYHGLSHAFENWLSRASCAHRRLNYIAANSITRA